ncbi:hypothetical protein J437_LFUL005861 [Ladona fulva]|uniref:Uncharacterized protein n=1 Tax=Ladona fulva TaxID=123851 RepID=A0A8K0K7G3_LADFU|nr:hypothetical protein J437_LFUL005861 [Ladona fulva]
METAGLLTSPAPSVSERNAASTASPWMPTESRTTIEEPKPTLSERELLKLEYYSTYDAMTGIRIAATLGGFFSLMVFLVVYKSKCRCKSSRKSVISEEELAEAVAKIEAEEKAAAQEGAVIMAAVAAAVQETGGCLEDDDAPLEAYYTLMARSGFSRRTASFSIARQSFGSVSGPTPRASCGNCASFRQRSLRQRRWGSGSGTRIPRRKRGKSLPGYATFGESAATDEAAAIAAAVQAAAALTCASRNINDDDSSCCYLEVPRRLSSVGSGSVSSYLEKRGSVVLLGLPTHPPPPPPRPRMATPPNERAAASQRRRRRRRESSRSSASASTSFPIDINVIQPTPDVSPRGSERQLDRHWKSTDAPAAAARVLAPLASYGTGGSSSSAASSLSSDPCPPGTDFDARSVGSDSVFFDDSSLAGSRRQSSVAPISSDSDDGVPPKQNFLAVPCGHRDHVWERGPPMKQSPNFLCVPSPNLRPTSDLPRMLAPPSPRPLGSHWCPPEDREGFSAGRRVSAPARNLPVGTPSCDTISAHVSATPTLITTPESPLPVLVPPPVTEDVRSTGLYRPFEATSIQPAERPTVLQLDSVRPTFRAPTSFSAKNSPCLTPPRGAESLSFPMLGGSCERLTVPDKGSRETLF